MLGPSSHRRVVTTDPAASRPPSQAGRSQGRQEIGPRKNPTLGREREIQPAATPRGAARGGLSEEVTFAPRPEETVWSPEMTDVRGKTLLCKCHTLAAPDAHAVFNGGIVLVFH